MSRSINRFVTGSALVAVVAASLAVAHPAFAQNDSAVNPANVFGTGPSYRKWDLKDKSTDTTRTTTISQFDFPFSQTIPIGHAFDLVGYGSYATTKLKLENGDEATLSGITDVRLKGIYRPMGQAQLSVGVNLPVGKQTLSEKNGSREVEVAQAMWSPILGFRTKRMGAGFDIEMGAGYAVPLSPTATLGLAAAYIAKGQYDLFETADGVVTFKPGPEASGTVGIDFRPAETTLFRLDVTGRRYGDDKSNDAPIFRAGTQFEVDATIARNTVNWTFLVRGRNVSRSNDQLVSESGSEVVRTGVTAPKSTWGLGELYRQLSAGLAFGAELQAASFGKSETALSDGKTFAFGPGLRLGQPGSRRVTLRALYLTGNAENGTIDLSGFDISLAAAVPF